MMKESKIRRVLAWTAAFVMLLALAPASAPAEESGTVTRVTIRPTRSIVLTNFIVDPDDADVTYADGVLIVNGGAVTIRNADPASATSDRIEIAGNATVTLAGVNISAGSSAGPAVKVKPEAAATIILENENTLTGSTNYAALEVGWESSSSFATVTIEGTGSLKATGGEKSAGIGGSYSNKNREGTTISSYCGNIIINGGTIVAVGNEGAGIGTANNNRKAADGSSTISASYKMTTTNESNELPVWGTITINDGNITASCNGGGAGIGGGNHVDGNLIKITGGTINATGGGGGGAGIGCGIGSQQQEANNTKGPGYYSANIEISGGDITAEGTWLGAGIGGGYACDAEITITGGTINAKGGNGNSGANYQGAPGVGAGYMGIPKLTISGGDITARGGTSAPGIGYGSGALVGDGKKNRGQEATFKYEDSFISISGGTIDATGGINGAGIGGGSGDQHLHITITGGDITARGYSDPANLKAGGAGIGSGTGKNGAATKYQSDTELDITITGGNITAIGGWGASGIGSGAENKMANEITISGNPEIQAYADGTKFAIDTRVVSGDTTTSRTEGRNVSVPVLQGTFVHEYTDNGVHQNPEGLNSIVITKDADGSEERELTGMPAGYRSFAATVSGNGQFNVYTDADSIGEGEGRYFAEAQQDIYDRDELEDSIGYTVTGSTLCDNFYLYPVKTFVAVKKVVAEEGTDLSGLNTTIGVELRVRGTGTVQDSGTIEIVNGKPQNRVCFVNVPDNQYEIWEMNGNKKMSPGTMIGTYQLKKIQTISSSGSNNNGEITDEKWTDSVTLVNTYGKSSQKISVSGEKTWEDSDNQDGIRPEQITVNLLADGKKADSKTVKAGEDGRWTYTFSGLDEYKGEKKITYTVSEEPVEGYTAVYNGMNIVNRHTPETLDISGTKTWNDGNDAALKRPKSVTVRLLANGTEAASKQVTEADNWKYTFTGLPRCKGGKEIRYTLKEDPVEGYQAAVNGFNVTNTLIPDEPVYRLTVRYWYEQVDGRTAAPTFTGLYKEGEKYRVKSPSIAGWSVDIKVVQGVMGTEDIVVDVVYTRNPYHLTIHYVDLFGNTMAPDYTDILYAGEDYYVESPVIEGYKTQTPLVSGTMPARDVVVTVIYYPEKVVHRRVMQVVFEEYETPLGVGAQSIDVGECVE